jgi:hypothetical protein
LSPGFYCVPVDVFGIDVDASLARRWAGWLAPTCQPFFLTATEVVGLGLKPDRPTRDLPAELRDTYEVWNLAEGLQVVWLDEQEFHAQPSDVRARLVRAQVRNGRVPGEIWREAAALLPHARKLSGTFASGSRGGSFTGDDAAFCFATVMASAGVQGANDVPMEGWLAAHCLAGGNDDLPGTVLVWRNADGNLQHAAVTLGGGWALHKPGQEWLTPRQVLAVSDLNRLAPPGVTLHRHSLRNDAVPS